MSHEIRTPLHGILGMADLASEAESQAECRRYMDMVKQCSTSLLTVINDILDVSKIEAGSLKLDPAPFQIREFLRQVGAVLGISAQQKGLAFTCEVDEKVPNGLVGDAGRLNQILINLVGNALKFTDAGTVTVRVDACELLASAPPPREKDSVRLRFSILDTGIGIERDTSELPKYPPVRKVWWDRARFNHYQAAGGKDARRYLGRERTG